MKKILLIIVILVVVVLSGTFYFLIPKGFHTVVHQMYIQQSLTPLNLRHSVVNSSLHRSEFDYTQGIRNFHMIVDSHTRFFPTENFIEVTIEELGQPEKVKLKLHLAFSGTAVGLRVAFEDFEKQSPNEYISLKGLDATIGYFTTDEFTNPDLLPEDILKNKSILIHIDEAKFDKGSQINVLAKNINFKFENIVSDNLMDLIFEINSQSFSLVNNMKPSFFKNSKFNFALKSLKYKELITFAKSINQNPATLQNPMMAMFGLMPVLNFPMILKVDSTSVNDDVPMKLKGNLNIKSKNVMDMNNYELSFSNTNSSNNIAMLLSGFVVRYYPQFAASVYIHPSEAKESAGILAAQATQSEIGKVLAQDLKTKNDKLVTAAVEMGIVKDNNGSLSVDFDYKNGLINLNSQEYQFQDFYNIAKSLMEKVYTPEEFQTLMLENGLALRNK